MKTKAPKAPKANNIGFKVGGANDITSFRDHINNYRMPRINDITFEGIYNDYYFDTESNQHGDDFKQDEITENDAIKDENDNEENSDEKDENLEDNKDLFYPSYCYGKCRPAYALLMANSIAPNVDINDAKSGDVKEDDVLLESTMIEEDIEDIEFNVDDNEIIKREIFMSIGLNSNISEDDFARKKLNIVILLDISGSMNKPFDDNTSEYMTKMQVACKSLIALLTHLQFNDRIGLILFNKNIQHRFYLTQFNKLSFGIIRNILRITANGGTDFEKGFNACIEQYKRLFNNLKQENNINSSNNNDEKDEIEPDYEYDNRIIVLTDMCPTKGKTGS
eukprot:450014_1